MDEVTRSILKYEEGGAYYTDAKEWYAHRYIRPFSERSLLVVLSIMMLVALILLFYTISSIHPLKTQVPLMIEADDSVDYMLTIKNIGKDYSTMHDAVVAYILERYVIAYESYRYSDVKDQLAYIYSTSSQQVYSNFYNLMSLDNPKSPIQQFQRAAQRIITVQSVSFPPGVIRSDHAVVRFKAGVESARTGATENTYWIAKIIFNVPDITRIAKEKTTNTIDFIVTSYQVEQIENGS